VIEEKSIPLKLAPWKLAVIVALVSVTVRKSPPPSVQPPIFAPVIFTLRKIVPANIVFAGALQLLIMVAFVRLAFVKFAPDSSVVTPVSLRPGMLSITIEI
jgi:hypothetical protein